MGRGRGRRGTPLEPFVKKRLLCRLNKSLLSGFLPILCFYILTVLLLSESSDLFLSLFYPISFYHLIGVQNDGAGAKKELKRVISFLTVHFFVSTAGQEAEIHLCLHVQFYSLRNKVDVQSLGDCQHWICFRLSCRVG